MDKPIYSVFSYDGGDSKSIGDATDSYRDACKIASDFFKRHDCKIAVKIVKSYVTHDVVKVYFPRCFHVSVYVPSKGIIAHYRNEDDFMSVISELVKTSVHFEVVSYES